MSIPATQLNRVFEQVGATDSYRGVYGFAHNELEEALLVKHDELCRVEKIVSEHTYVTPQETAFAIKVVFGTNVFGLAQKKNKHARKEKPAENETPEQTKEREAKTAEREVKAVERLRKEKLREIETYEKKAVTASKKAERFMKKALDKKASLQVA